MVISLGVQPVERRWFAVPFAEDGCFSAVIAQRILVSADERNITSIFMCVICGTITMRMRYMSVVRLDGGRTSQGNKPGSGNGPRMLPVQDGGRVERRSARGPPM